MHIYIYVHIANALCIYTTLVNQVLTVDMLTTFLRFLFSSKPGFGYLSALKSVLIITPCIY